jgi:HEPN domain-containing protein
MNELPNHWLVFAREDLHVAELVFDKGIYNQACFHAQQCVEKAL